ncbi:hypothetical protein N7481_003280 [Penicillium waksmanii]|uniref:uncharacterized protein n=1 Tax=Penicillium waksmanii TaxID=69791 RepID=UPI0025491B41|nr:uncharacterized protein N7481_003280 [Penicillium waksmanii]KAJ5988070.1 hypothetical protein N7481_003280 [Penicillium waksmanii]
MMTALPTSAFFLLSFGHPSLFVKLQSAALLLPLSSFSPSVLLLCRSPLSLSSLPLSFFFFPLLLPLFSILRVSPTTPLSFIAALLHHPHWVPVRQNIPNQTQPKGHKLQLQSILNHSADFVATHEHPTTLSAPPDPSRFCPPNFPTNFDGDVAIWNTPPLHTLRTLTEPDHLPFASLPWRSAGSPSKVQSPGWARDVAEEDTTLSASK